MNREIWRLAWPTFIAQGVHSVIFLITRSIIASLGNEAFIGVSIGLLIFFVIVTFLASVGVGVTALVAQAVGAGDRERASRLLQQSLMLGALMALVITTLGIPISHLIFDAITQDPAVAQAGKKFTISLLVFLLPLSFGFIFGAALRGAGDTRTPMITGVIMGALTLFLNIALINGKWGFPALGINGAIIAMIVAFFSNSFILGVLFLLKKTVLVLPMRGWRPELKVWKDILRIGIPSALEWTLIQIGLIIYIKIVNQYDTDIAAGYFIGMPVLQFAQTPVFGFQTAATTLVGQAIGAKRLDRAETAFRQNVRFAILAMTVLAVVLYFSAEVLVHTLFKDNGMVAQGYGIVFVRMVALVMPLMAISFTVSGGLRGSGDTVAPLIAQNMGMFIGRLGFAFAAYYLFHPPILVIWASMYPDLIIRDIGVLYRMLSGKWKLVGRSYQDAGKRQATAPSSE